MRHDTELERRMGLFDSLGDSGPGETKYTVVARDRKNQPVALPDELDDSASTFHGDPMNKETWRHEHGEALEEGVSYYCLEVHENGYDFEEPEWVLEIEGGDNPAKEVSNSLRSEIQSLRETVQQQETGDNPLVDVSDTEELMSKGLGMGMAKAAQEGDMDTYMAMFDRLAEVNSQDASSPANDLLGGVENNMEVSSPGDLAMLMMLPELKDMTKQGKTLMDNFNGMMGGQSAGRQAASGLSGGGGGQQQGNDKVELTREQFEELKQRATSSGGGGQQQQAQPEPEPEPEPDTGGGSFSMDEYAAEDDEADEEPAEPDEDDADEEPEDAEPSTGTPDEADAMSAAPEIEEDADSNEA